MKPRPLAGVRFCVAIAAATCVVAAGCTAVKKTPPAAKKSTEPYRVEKEGNIPPLMPREVRKEADRVDSYEDLPVTEQPVEVETVEPVTPPPTRPEGTSSIDPTKSPGPPPKTMDGYRIQVFASGSEDVARSAEQAAEVRLGMAAYVELIDGIYKVRVGDCPTREEADALLKKCREAGYGDAWVAVTRIVIPKR
jgi:cell division septation protein DedD